jgi:hypothetical protein
MHSCYPLAIDLPDGTTARVRIVHVVEVNDKGEELLTQLVSTPPQYERCDGTTVELDVTIPDDLAAHWFWFGSCLVEDSGLVLICTATYPPPGYPSIRGTCFDVARQIEAGQRRRAERWIAERVAIVMKVKRPKTSALPVEPAPVQAVMELV